MIHGTIAELAVPLADLHPYERNPRRGNVAVIRDSLAAHGQYRPIVVNQRGNVVLAGNHTWAAAKELGWEMIAATFVDVDEETAARIVLMDNRAADLGRNDSDLLAQLLGGLPDLDGTGYSQADLDKLLGRDVAEEEEFTSRYEVVVECADEDAQRDIFDRLTGEGWTCRVLSL